MSAVTRSPVEWPASAAHLGDGSGIPWSLTYGAVLQQATPGHAHGQHVPWPNSCAANSSSMGGLKAWIGPPDSFGCDGMRVHNLQTWLECKGLTGVPLDKIVLQLDAVGIQLSTSEQDQLKACLCRHAACRGQVPAMPVPQVFNGFLR